MASLDAQLDSSVPYFAELLPKVGTVTILVGRATDHPPPLNHCLENLSLNSNTSLEETSYHASATATMLSVYSNGRQNKEAESRNANVRTEDIPIITVPLPASIDDTAIDLTPFEDGYELKCQIAQPSSSQPVPKPSVPETRAPLPASELQGLRDIRCANCEQTILQHKEDGVIFERVLDLPSEHWLELVDSWMCHQEDYPQFRRGAIAVKPNMALIGHTYVMIHAANIDQNRISLQKDESGNSMVSFRKWHTVRCQDCNTLLGEGMLNETDSEAAGPEANEEMAFKIYKHTAQFHVVDSITSQIRSIQPHPISTFVAADMLETAKAHASYRFAVYDRNNSRNKPYILAWLFQWDSKVCTNAKWSLDQGAFSGRSAQHLLQGVGKTMNVMKILYIDCMTENDSAAERISKSWLQDKPHANQVEQLTYEKEECLEILSALRLSTACLPPSRRKGLGGFQFGFLQRN